MVTMTTGEMMTRKVSHAKTVCGKLRVRERLCVCVFALWVVGHGIGGGVNFAVIKVAG